MDLPGARRDRPVHRSALPRLEPLEDRLLLSPGKTPATVTIHEVPIHEGPNTSTLFPGTTILELTGTKKNDSITITDDGTGAAGNIFISVAGGQDFMSAGTVSEIAVPTGTGSDRVTYELDGDLR